MSANLGISILGAGLGFIAGAPFGLGALGARIGFTIGSIAGGLLNPPNAGAVEGPRLTDLHTMAGNEGSPLPIVYGSARIGTTVIWTNGIDETISSEGGGGGKGGAPASPEVTTYTYSASFAVACCEGEITGVRRIWADTKLIYDARDTATAESFLASGDITEEITVYNGSESQTADPLIVSIEGATKTPAFRGIAYIVFKNLQLGNYGNRIPNINVEVVVGGTTAPPVRLNTFATPITTKDMVYVDGLIKVPSIQINVPENGKSTHTIKTYDLSGNLLVQEDYVGTNNNSATNVSFIAIKNLPEIYFNRQEAAGTGQTVGAWWVRDFGGAEGLLIPGAPQPWSPDGFLSGGTFDYYRAIGHPVFWNGYIYAVNYGTTNEHGVARYPINYLRGLPLPDSRPDAFYALDTHIVATGSELVSLHTGDDGLLYVLPRAGAGATYLDGTAVLRLDPDLNFVNAFKMPSNLPSDTNISAWDDKMTIVNANDLLTDANVDLYDISAATLAANSNTAVLIGTTDHDQPNGSRNNQGISNGLFVMDDGVWHVDGFVTLDAPTLRTVVEDICQRTGLALGQIDATPLTKIVHGYVIQQPMAARQAIQGLQPWGLFDGFESEGKVKFTNRGGASVVTIPDDDIGAFSSKPPVGNKIRIRQQEVELPAEIDILYPDLNQDYEIGAQPARRIITTSINRQEFALATVMTSTEAAQVADIMLQNMWAERVRYKFTLTRKYDYLDPADLITIPIATGNQLVRIVDVTEGADGILDVEAVIDLTTVYSSVAVGNDAELEDTQTLALKGPTKLIVVDEALLRDRDNSPGYYVAAAGYYGAWSGAAIYRNDDEVDLIHIKTLLNPATCGIVNGVLPQATYFGIDTINTLNVSLTIGTLSSVTYEQFLAGNNTALVGEEIIYFQNAVLEADGTYTLKKLVREIGGTDSGSHVNTERFLLLESNTLRSVEGELTDTNLDALFKAATLGAASTEPTTLGVTLENQRITPRAPAFPFASKQPNGDIVGKFIRRGRIAPEWLDVVDMPLDETTEAYELDVLDVSNTVLRTITIDATKVFTYTTAQQITDFGGSVSAPSFNLHQMSDRVGRGRVATFQGHHSPNLISGLHTEILTDSPLAFWPLNPVTQLTESIAGKDLSNTDGDEGTQWRWDDQTPLILGQGSLKQFGTQAPGNGTRFQIDDDAFFNNITDRFSVEFIIKANLTTSGAHENIVSCYAYTNANSTSSTFAIYFPNGQRNNLTFSVNPTGAAVAQAITTTGETMNDGIYHHVMCVWDNKASVGTQKMYIYVDGVESVSATLTASLGTVIESFTAPIFIMSSNSLQWNGWGTEGYILSLAMYTEALSAARVTSHFTATGL